MPFATANRGKTRSPEALLQSQSRRNGLCDTSCHRHKHFSIAVAISSEKKRPLRHCNYIFNQNDASVAISSEKKRLLRHFATNMWALWSFSCNLSREETPFATFCDEHVGAVVVQLQPQARRNAFCDILRRTCGRCGRSVAISVEKKRLLRHFATNMWALWSFSCNLSREETPFATCTAVLPVDDVRRS